MLVHHAAADNPISVVVFHDPRMNQKVCNCLCVFQRRGLKRLYVPSGNISFPPVLIEPEFSLRPLNKLAARQKRIRERDPTGANYFGVMPERYGMNQLLCVCVK